MSAILTAFNYAPTFPPKLLGSYTNSYQVVPGTPTLSYWYSDTPFATGQTEGTSNEFIGISSRSEPASEWVFNGVDNIMWTLNEKFVTPEYPRPEFAYNIWFKCDQGSRGKKIIGVQNAAAMAEVNRFDRHLYFGDTGFLYFGMYDGNVGNKVCLSNQVLAYDTYYMATVTYSEGVFKLYLNGQYQSQNFVTTPDNNSMQLVVGGGKLDSWPAGISGYWKGEIHSLYVWYQTLSPEQVISIYNATKSWPGHP